jgi:hypothetical protein
MICFLFFSHSFVRATLSASETTALQTVCTSLGIDPCRCDPVPTTTGVHCWTGSDGDHVRAIVRYSSATFQRWHGSIPTEIGQLSKLTQLYFYGEFHASVIGVIPSGELLTRFSFFPFFYFLRSSYVVRLSLEIGLLTSLVDFQLVRQPMLTGTVPTQLSRLKLATLIFIGTGLSGRRRSYVLCLPVSIKQ